MKRHLAHCFVLFLLFIPQKSYSQDNLQVIGELRYARWDGKWYIAVNGERAAKVDTNHVVVRLKNDGFLEDLNFRNLGIPQLEDVRGRFAGSFYELKIPELANPFNILRKLHDSGLFVDVHLNIYGEITAVPNDYYYPDSWNLPKINMPQVWNHTKGSSQVVVAVIDVGTEYNHPDLVKNKGIGYDFYDMDSDPSPENIENDDRNYHGTAVTGVLCADLNNTIGVSGIAGGWGSYKGITFMSLRAGINGNIDISAASAAIEEAADWGADIINCSWTTTDTTTISELKEAISYATDSKNVVVVFSSGNINYGGSKFKPVRFPGNMARTIAVGASTTEDKRKSRDDEIDTPWGSCYGPELDVVAPGVFIPTTDIEGSYGKSTTDYYLSFRGTSAAAPHVAALAALILSIDPGLDWQEVRDVIRNNAAKVGGYSYPDGRNDEMGYGRINAYAAVSSVQPPPAPTGLIIANAGEEGVAPILEWNAVGTATSYKVFRRVNSGSWVYLWTESIATYTDEEAMLDPETNDLLEYYVTAVNTYGESGPSNTASATGWLQKAMPGTPATYSISPNFPNPFNPVTTLRYDLPEASNVSLVVYDIAGREVRGWNLQEPAGYRQVMWDGKYQNGQLAPTGLYIYRLVASSTESEERFMASRKMVLMK